MIYFLDEGVSCVLLGMVLDAVGLGEVGLRHDLPAGVADDLADLVRIVRVGPLVKELRMPSIK